MPRGDFYGAEGRGLKAIQMETMIKVYKWNKLHLFETGVWQLLIGGPVMFSPVFSKERKKSFSFFLRFFILLSLPLIPSEL